MATIDGENLKNIRESMDVSIYVTTNDETLYYTNDDILTCTLNLRSDLSIIGPTLPESEIEFTVYSEEDISDVLAEIPLGATVRYYAGYIGDWAPVRRFYVDEPITWENHVIRIHAADQVNRLEGEFPSVYIGQVWDRWQSSTSTKLVFRKLLEYFKDVIRGTPTGNNNIYNFTREEYFLGEDGEFSTIPSGGALNALVEHKPRREIIANIMNICHVDLPENYYNNMTAFWPTYVDAGRPTITNTKPTPKWTIYEEDCGDVVSKKERKVQQYNFIIQDVEPSGYFRRECDVDAEIIKQKCIFLSYNGFISDQRWGLWDMTPHDEEVDFDAIYMLYPDQDLIKRSRPYTSSVTDTAAWLQSNKYGKWLFDETTGNNDLCDGYGSVIDLSGSKWTSPPPGYSSYDSPATRWQKWINNGYIDANATNVTLDTSGYFFSVMNPRTLSISADPTGDVVNVENPIWNGHVYAKKYNGTDSEYLTILPDMGLQQLTQRSKTIGSFTWKGDPRMQPRDVFIFAKLSYGLANENGVELTDENGEPLEGGGGDVECTIETITLTHEKGGTVAEITYREGIC